MTFINACRRAELFEIFETRSLGFPGICPKLQQSQEQDFICGVQ